MCTSLSAVQKNSARWFTGILIFFTTIFAGYSNIHAASVLITWDPNPESDLAGYNLYNRALPSPDFGQPVFSGLPGNPSAPSTIITGLSDGTTYEFMLTAFDTSGNESTPSLEKQITINSGTTPPPGGGAPVEAWTAVAQNPGVNWVDSGWDFRSFRQFLKGSAITTSGSTVQLTLRGRTTGNYTVQHVSLVQRDGATLNGVDATNRQVTFGSTWDAGVTVPPAGVTSDPIAFDLVAGQDVFLTFWVPAGTPTVVLDGGTTTSTWVIRGTDESTTIDWEGLPIDATRPNIFIAEVVEVLN